MLYTIEDTTLTALGDAVRDKVGVGTKTSNFILQGQENTLIVELGAASKYKLSFRADIYWDNLQSSFIRIYDSYDSRIFHQDIKAANNDTEVVGELIVSCPTVEFAFSLNPYLNPNAYAEITMTAIALDENGNEFKYTPLEMVEELNAVDVMPPELLNLSGNCRHKFAQSAWNWVINKYGNKMTTNNITDASNMFLACVVDSIPFTLNMANDAPLSSMFSYCSELKEYPEVNMTITKHLVCDSLFGDNYKMREIPEWFIRLFEEDAKITTSNPTFSPWKSLFASCYSLRKIPDRVMKSMRNPQITGNYYTVAYSKPFSNCYSLDELMNITCDDYGFTSNQFGSFFNTLSRIKNLTFETNEDGTPVIRRWKSQTFDLTQNIGYLSSTSYRSHVLNYNSGITADKEVTDDATYAALKNDPDWFTVNRAYSRYNHDSAVATINSLPDCSATGTNTIKFKGDAGSKTDGGAINTLTEAEIAVAAAKGWTVSLT
jgi:hypothetical protein